MSHTKKTGIMSHQKAKKKKKKKKISSSISSSSSPPTKKKKKSHKPTPKSSKSSKSSKRRIVVIDSDPDSLDVAIDAVSRVGHGLRVANEKMRKLFVEKKKKKKSPKKKNKKKKKKSTTDTTTFTTKKKSDSSKKKLGNSSQKMKVGAGKQKDGRKGSLRNTGLEAVAATKKKKGRKERRSEKRSVSVTRSSMEKRRKDSYLTRTLKNEEKRKSMKFQKMRFSFSWDNSKNKNFPIGRRSSEGSNSSASVKTLVKKKGDDNNNNSVKVKKRVNLKKSPRISQKAKNKKKTFRKSFSEFVAFGDIDPSSNTKKNHLSKSISLNYVKDKNRSNSLKKNKKPIIKPSSSAIMKKKKESPFVRVSELKKKRKKKKTSTSSVFIKAGDIKNDIEVSPSLSSSVQRNTPQTSLKKNLGESPPRKFKKKAKRLMDYEKKINESVIGKTSLESKVEKKEPKISGPKKTISIKSSSILSNKKDLNNSIKNKMFSKKTNKLGKSLSFSVEKNFDFGGDKNKNSVNKKIEIESNGNSLKMIKKETKKQKNEDKILPANIKPKFERTLTPLRKNLKFKRSFSPLRKKPKRSPLKKDCLSRSLRMRVSDTINLKKENISNVENNSNNVENSDTENRDKRRKIRNLTRRQIKERNDRRRSLPVKMKNFFVPFKTISNDLKDEKVNEILNIISELIITEESFFNDLMKVKDYFEDPIKQKNVIVYSKVLMCFKKLEEIRFISQSFLRDLKEKVDCKKDATNKLEEACLIIIQHCNNFKKYADYISHFNDLQNALDEEKKNNLKMNEICKDAYLKLKESGSRITELRGFTITPIQRLPRIVLLLNQILKIITEEFFIRSKVEHAKKMVEMVTSYCNQKTKEVNNIEKLKGYQKKFGIFVTPNSKIFKEGEVMRIRKSEKILESVIILTDSVLIVYPKKRPIDRTFFKKPYIVQYKTSKHVSYKDEDGKNIKVSFVNSVNKKKEIKLLFSTEKEKNEWLELFKKKFI